MIICLISHTLSAPIPVSVPDWWIFSMPVMHTDLDLPEDQMYCPPITIRCVDCRSFGRFVLVGTHTINSLQRYVCGSKSLDKPADSTTKGCHSIINRFLSLYGRSSVLNFLTLFQGDQYKRQNTDITAVSVPSNTMPANGGVQMVTNYVRSASMPSVFNTETKVGNLQPNSFC